MDELLFRGCCLFGVAVEEGLKSPVSGGTVHHSIIRVYSILFCFILSLGATVCRGLEGPACIKTVHPGPCT